MNKHDMAKLRNGSRAIGLILKKDSRELDPDVKLNPTDRNFLSGARAGLVELLKGDKERLEQRLVISNDEYKKALEDDFDVQMEMFSDNTGKPTTELDANGKAKQTERNWDGDMPAPGDGGGIDPEDGEQLELNPDEEAQFEQAKKKAEAILNPPAAAEETQPEPTPVVDKAWAVNPDVPDHIETGLVGHVANGKTRGEAVKLIMSATGLPKLVMDGYFDRLVKKGSIGQKGRSYFIPDKPAAPPAADAAPKESIQEMLLAELRSGTTDIDVAMSNVMFQSNAERGVISRILMEMCDDGRVDELTDGRWVAVEPSDVPTEEVDGAAGDQAETPAPEQPAEKPVVLAIKRMVSENKGDRDIIVEAVSMELEIPAEQVMVEWKTLVFAGIIRRGAAGWIIAPEMEPEAASA